MRTSKVWPFIAVCVASFAMPLWVSAQQNNPPQLEKLEEGEAPAVTIRKPDGERKITEKREQGKVKQVKVQSGKSTYYLKPNDPAGSALRGDTESSTLRAPQWQILEFGEPKPGKEVEPPPFLAPRPSPAAEAAPSLPAKPAKP